MPNEKHILHVVFGDSAIEYAEEHGYEKTRRHLRRTGADGEAHDYGFDTERDLNTAIWLLQESSGWDNYYYETGKKNTTRSRAMMVRNAAIDDILLIVAKRGASYADEVDESAVSGERPFVFKDPVFGNFELNGVVVDKSSVSFLATDKKLVLSRDADKMDIESLLGIVDYLEKNEGGVVISTESVIWAKYRLWRKDNGNQVPNRVTVKMHWNDESAEKSMTATIAILSKEEHDCDTEKIPDDSHILYYVRSLKELVSLVKPKNVSDFVVDEVDGFYRYE